MAENRLIVIGKIGKPFGIKGQMRIVPFTETIAPFVNSKELWIGESKFKVESLGAHKGALLVKFEGIQTPEVARTFSGNLVRTNTDNLPPKDEDEYYWFELIGMQVITVSGKRLGTIDQITPTGANDVLHVSGDLGEILLPMIDEVVLEIRTEENVMIVDPLEGLLPDA